MDRVLDKYFFARDALLVAPDLIGTVLCRRFENGTIFRGVISEVEAYLQNDPACHAFKGETPRNSVMFGPAGIAYVYFIYGMYHCLNIVTEHPGSGQAVLFRGVLPIDESGVLKPLLKQTNGPGKLCRYLNIDRTMNGVEFSEKNPIWLEHKSTSPLPPFKLQATPRIGISQAKENPWRWVLKNESDFSG